MFLQIFFVLAGRLHPALVHLPIGILLLACCFELLAGGKKFSFLQPAIRPMMFWGMVAAVLSVLSGLALAAEDDYTDDIVNTHQWVGISLAVIAIILYILYRRSVNRKLVKTFSLITLCLVFVTGHLGGSITHGEGFITAAFDGSEEATPIKPIPDIQNVMAYNGVVQPIFEARCYRCHSESKQKGKLRLDNQEFILKGGKSKKTIVAGKPEESELIQRLLLPLEDDDHMPPKGKPQLSKEQIQYLQWWVGTGVDFQKKVGDLPQTEAIKPALLALEAGSATPEEQMAGIPDEPVVAADTAIIAKLSRAGVALLPVARESNYLSANFVTAGKKAETLIDELIPLKKQLVSLKLDGANVHDSTLKKIAQLSALRNLQISHTPVTDEGIRYLAQLQELRSLNLVNTEITALGLEKLRGNKEIKNIYLYQTGVKEADMARLKTIFPKSQLEFGNYTLPMLATDTTEVKF